jgi:heterodisulfide reductase subunit A
MRVTDHVLGLPVEITTDLLTLAAAIVPYADEQLAQFFKMPLNDDGFFVEKHAKLGPSNLPRTVCSSAGWPITPNPSTRPFPGKSGGIAGRDPAGPGEHLYQRRSGLGRSQMCSSCGVCVSICPYSAPSFIEEDARMFAGRLNHQPGPVQGVRPVRGLLPVRRHSSQWIRQQPDFCHARCHLIEKRTGGGTGGPCLPLPAGP